MRLTEVSNMLSVDNIKHVFVEAANAVDDKQMQTMFSKRILELAKVVGFDNTRTYVLPLSKSNASSRYVVYTYLKREGDDADVKDVRAFRVDGTTITEYNADTLTPLGPSKSKLGVFAARKLENELKGIFVKFEKRYGPRDTEASFVEASTSEKAEYKALYNILVNSDIKGYSVEGTYFKRVPTVAYGVKGTWFYLDIQGEKASDWDKNVTVYCIDGDGKHTPTHVRIEGFYTDDKLCHFEIPFPNNEFNVREFAKQVLTKIQAAVNIVDKKHLVSKSVTSSKNSIIVQQLHTEVERFQKYLDLLHTVPRASVTKPSVIQKIMDVNAHFKFRQYNDLYLRLIAVQKSFTAAWQQVFSKAIRTKYGREPVTEDYKVSAIGDSSLPDNVKEELRFLAHTETALDYLKDALTVILNKRSLKQKSTTASVTVHAKNEATHKALHEQRPCAFKVQTYDPKVPDVKAIKSKVKLNPATGVYIWYNKDKSAKDAKIIRKVDCRSNIAKIGRAVEKLTGGAVTRWEILWSYVHDSEDKFDTKWYPLFETLKPSRPSWFHGL